MGLPSLRNKCEPDFIEVIFSSQKLNYAARIPLLRGQKVIGTVVGLTPTQELHTKPTPDISGHPYASIKHLRAKANALGDTQF